MPELLMSVAAGAGGGILVVVGERFLFSAPSAFYGLKKSLRFYLQNFREWRGERVISCSVCWCPEPQSVQNPELLPEGWDRAPPNTSWLRCTDCGHVWGVRAIITRFFTRFFPVEDDDG